MWKYCLCLCLFLSLGQCQHFISDCGTKSNYDEQKEHDWWYFMLKCHYANSNAHFFIDIATQFNTWFNLSNIMFFLFLTLIFLPYFRPEKETDASKLNSFRLQGNLLLFRLAFTLSFVVALQLLFRQVSPCDCIVSLPYGMPSMAFTVCAVLSLHFIEEVNVILGIIMLIVFALKELVLGFSSIIQLIVALGIALILHFYGTRTRSFLRVVDFFFTLIFCSVVLIAEKRSHQDEDFSSSSFVIFEGFIFQMFCILFPNIYFSRAFARRIAIKSAKEIDEFDSLFYSPLQGPSSFLVPEGGEDGQPRRANITETVVSVFSVVAVFAAHVVSRVVSDHIDSWLS
eukprot:GCRY01000542.1.p1 GENE.GCRY01000542.1~~GCRY01000542.1.p1  ORF type:complete len:342 (-),score=31.65 GCRY01000542.1:326-1351(-)